MADLITFGAVTVSMEESESPIEIWKGEFGERWTDRNAQNPFELDENYFDIYGVTRTRLNERFLEDICRDARILEVGANAGAQLRCLWRMGFRELYGVELLDYAVRQASEMGPPISLIQGNAFELPFDDKSFDLVFTSGLLIHIPPEDIDTVMREIARCSDHYLWGFEYYSENYTEVAYRDHDNLLWKGDFPAMYEEYTPFNIVKKELIDYRDSDNVDAMFLLERDS